MASNLRELVDPKATAIVIDEMQEGIAGRLARAPLDALAKLVKERDLAQHLGRLSRLHAASERTSVMACTKRPDGLGTSIHTPLTEQMVKLGAPPLIQGSEAVKIMHELGPEAGDFIISRTHGWHPFQGTELDSILRNIGIKTVVACGVSTNIGVQGIAVEAINHNYHCVIPSDCVVGFPAEYGDMSLKYGVGIIAHISNAKDIVSAWGIDWNQL